MTARELIQKSARGFKTGVTTDAPAATLDLSERMSDSDKESVVLSKSFDTKTKLNVIMDIGETKREDIKKMQERIDDILLVDRMLNGVNQGGKVSANVKNLKIYKRFMRDMETGVSELAKIMTTTGSGTGAEWIPTGWSTQLQEKIQLERKIAAAIPQFTMQQTPYYYPIQTQFGLAYRGAEDTDATDSTVGTGKTLFTAQKLQVSIPVSYEDEEDSIIDMLPLVKQQMAIALSRAEENLLINGNYTTNPGTANTTYDSDNGTIGNIREMISATCYLGMRTLALANGYTTDLSTFNDATISAMRAKLGVYYDPNKCFWSCGTSVWCQLSSLKTAGGLPVVQQFFNTGDQNYSMKTGVLGLMYGSPVYRSEFMRERLTAAGIYDGSTVTKAGLLLARSDAFKIGNHKRGVMVESERRPRTQRTDLIASMRQDFQSIFPIASNHVVEFGINITA